MRYLICFFCCMASSVSAVAQVSVPEVKSDMMRESVYGVGLSGGAASGFGLSFRQHLPGKFSYQLVGGVIKADRKTSLTIGGELQLDFTRTTVTRFFGTAAFGYFYSGENENSLSAPLRAGFGIGMEYQPSQPLALAGELLFTFFNDGDIIPLPQISLHYYFY